MFTIAIVSISAPKCNGGQYRRPVDIRIYEPAQNAGMGQKGKGQYRQTVREWHNVDSRYNGPKSAYGRALRNAKSLCNRLNAECYGIGREERQNREFA